ncbi:nucleotide exchange factor GrpE [Candidatus Parcubacteria bacterium]|nr:nucleotide exchange factor GrpE [Candidatus Parcubacteria bacterium]
MDDDKKHNNLDGENDASYDDDVTVEPTSDEGDAASLQSKLSTLREKLKAAEKDRADYLAGWQRAKADLINWKREAESSKKETLEFANQRLIDELLPVLDAFQLAFGNKKAWETVAPGWRQGVEHIYAKFIDVLRSHGLELIGAAGEDFTPELHAAIESVPTDDEDDDGKVAAVLQPGFKLKERVIRPAKVTVYAFNNK